MNTQLPTLEEDWRAYNARIRAEIDAEETERERRRAAWQARRDVFREKLFGSSEAYDRQAPAPLADSDALLGEHLAQLRNAARHTMEQVLSDDLSVERRVKAGAALDRFVRTNLAIVKALREEPTQKTSKTVRGGRSRKGAQD